MEKYVIKYRDDGSENKGQTEVYADSEKEAVEKFHIKIKGATVLGSYLNSIPVVTINMTSKHVRAKILKKRDGGK